MAKITVQNTDISVVKYNEEDYISLTDMARSQLQDEHGNIFAKMNTSAFIVEDKIHAIYENGKLVNQHAEIKEYQEYLETYVLGINFITFSQTVIISKTKYTPFMKLRSGERRQFVESILNIEVFGDMLKLQTKKISDLKFLNLHHLSISRINANNKIIPLSKQKFIPELSEYLYDQIIFAEVGRIAAGILFYTGLPGNKSYLLLELCCEEIEIIEAQREAFHTLFNGNYIKIFDLYWEKKQAGNYFDYSVAKRLIEENRTN